MADGADVRRYINLLAGKHLAGGGRIELRNTGIALEQAPDIALEGRQVGGRDERLATVHHETDKNLVFLVLGGEECNLDAVREGPLGDALDELGSLLDLAALEACRIYEFGLDLLFCICSNLRCFDSADNAKELLLGRIGKTFFLGAVVEHHHVLVGDELADNLVDSGCGNHLHNGLGELVLGSGLHIRSIVEEVADERLYEFGILTAVGSACPALIAAQDIILCPLDFCVAEAVALHLLDLGIESL